MLCFRGKAKDQVYKGSDNEYLEKPFRPEALSRSVDWLPALFADTKEYLRLGVKLVSLHAQGWSAWMQGQ